MLKLCERFGWTLDYVWSLNPSELQILFAYEDIRAIEEIRSIQ